MAYVAGELAVLGALNEGARTALLSKSQSLAERNFKLQEREFEHQKNLSKSLDAETQARLMLDRDKMNHDVKLQQEQLLIQKQNADNYSKSIQMDIARVQGQQATLVDANFSDVVASANVIFDDPLATPEKLEKAMREGISGLQSAAMLASQIDPDGKLGLYDFYNNKKYVQMLAWQAKLDEVRRKAAEPKATGLLDKAGGIAKDTGKGLVILGEAGVNAIKNAVNTSKKGYGPGYKSKAGTREVEQTENAPKGSKNPLAELMKNIRPVR